MSLNPRIGLLFDGRCEEAFRFYEQCLNGKLEFVLRWGESPTAQDAPAEWRNKILHAKLMVKDAELLGGDALPEPMNPHEASVSDQPLVTPARPNVCFTRSPTMEPFRCRCRNVLVAAFWLRHRPVRHLTDNQLREIE